MQNAHLRRNTGMKTKNPQGPRVAANKGLKMANMPSAGKTLWHTAFFQAIQQELSDYKDSLEFKYEHPLAEQPLRIDLLIIKKPQIIESRKLPEGENLWLKSLAKDLQAVSAGSIIDEVQKCGNEASLGAYLDVLWRANPKAFSEAETMARKRETFEEVYTKNGVIPGYIEQGRVQGREEGRVQGLEQGLTAAARNAMSKGLPIDVIHDITGLDIETIKQLGSRN